MEILLKILGYTCLTGVILVLILVLIYIVFERWDAARHPVPRTCLYCKNYQAGDVDARVNYCICLKGHRLIAAEEKDILHTTSDGETLRVNQYGWCGGDGFGPPMFDRSDCPDWRRATGCSEIHSMEY